MYKAKLISADFEESTMEFEIQHEFTAKAGDYVILTKQEYESELNKLNLDCVSNRRELLIAFEAYHNGRAKNPNENDIHYIDSYLDWVKSNL